MDQASTPYLDALVAYADREPARFHVPGHKGGRWARPGTARGARRTLPAARHPGRDRGHRRRSRSCSDAVPAGTAAGRRGMGGEAQLVSRQRRLWRQPRSLPRARARRRAGRRPAQRPLVDHRWLRRLRAAAAVRRARARPRARDRALPDRRGARRSARRGARRGRRDGRLADLLRRRRRHRRSRRGRSRSATCRWSSTRPGAPT